MGANGADPPLFSLEVRTDDDARTTIAVAGELDLASVGAFSRAVQEGLATGAVVIDLRQVTFMDSSGVRALNAALRAAAENGRELRLSGGLHPNVVQVLQLTGMLELLPVEGGR